MKAIKRGQIINFHTPYKDEDRDQLYVVLEVFDDDYRTRAQIMALQTGLSYPPINVVYAEDLEIDNLLTKQLVRYLNVVKSP